RFVPRLSQEADRGIRAFYDGYMGERSLFDMVGSAGCRSLVFRAERYSLDGVEEWKRGLFAAYFAGVEAGLARIAARPGVRVCRVDAGHMLNLEQPALLVRGIREFLA
ncbi:MAG: alpha/beta fold hydrolase, partial [Janthinobacterium lividum]